MVDLANNEIFSANSTTLSTDFNVTPYYDDYDIKKQFYRILFKPGYAVQARELTQMQSIIQKQVDLFGRNIFKEGSIVIPGEFILDLKSPYVKVKDLDAASNEVTISTYKNLEVTGVSSGVVGTIVDVVDGTQSSSNTKTIYVGYTSISATDPTVKTFQQGESLTTSDGKTLVVVDSSPSGTGARFIIREGVIFAKEHFIYFPAQSIVLSRYSNNPSCKVGFYITEEIITSLTDSSLLDPAQEASNFSAPGADRFKLSPELQVIAFDQQNPKDFIELFSIDNGIVTERFDRSQYNIIGDEIAKRTFDESGDYYVRGLGVRVRENLDTGINGGFDASGSSSRLSIGVEPGTGYVKGYEVNKLVTEYITIDKANTYSNVSGQIATATMGSYVTCNQAVGMITADIGAQVTLYNQTSRRLTNKTWTAGSPSGANIGTAKIQSVQYESGLLGAPDGQIRVYLFDVKMSGTNPFSSVKHVANTSSSFGADVVLDTISGKAVLNEPGLSTLIYNVGSDSTRTLRGSDGNPKMNFNFLRTSTISIQSTGTATVSFTSDASEIFPYGTTTLSDSDKKEIMLSVGVSSNIVMTGIVSGTSGTDAVTGVGTKFNRLNVGDKIEFAGVSNTFFIKTITSDTSLTLTENLPSTVTSAVFYKAYKAGDLIDLTSKGSNDGSRRVVTATPTQLTINLNESFVGDLAGSKITYPVARTATSSPYAREITKSLRQNRLVIINVGTQASRLGPFNLGFSDVYRINKIVKKTGSAPSSLTDGTDVTQYFIFDDGQRDTHYEHASIRPSGINCGATDYFLVSLDYFSPSFTSGRGYFSVNSYPIDDDSATLPSGYIRTEDIPYYISPTTGIGYNLRNSIDFRPVKSSTATDTTTVGTASTNPARTGAFLFETNGLRMPIPASQFTYDYSYYLARQDIIALDKDGSIKVLKGTPAAIPFRPEANENSMPLSQIYVSPFPSLSPFYANAIGRPDLACRISKISNVRFTMRDIGVLKDRIENLEYYNALNLLEKAATDLQILDENGLSRFKNGYFVDTFNDHSLGDTNNPNYKIVVDPLERSIRPYYDIKSFKYDVISNTKVNISNGLLHLPFTEKVLLEQPIATSYRNVEVSSYRFNGKMTLYPDTDVWVDSDVLPDNQIVTGPAQEDVPATMITWNQWQSQIVGTSSSTTSQEVYAYGSRWGTSKGPGPTSQYGYKLQPEGGILGFGGYNDRWLMNTTTTTTTTQNSRTGTQTNYSLESSSVSLGERVVGIEYPAYIRPQVIRVSVLGLLPNSRVYPFFDGESVDSFCTPITTTQFQDYDDGTITPSLWTNVSAEGSNLKVNTDGSLYFLLRIAPSKWTIGTKEVRVIDSPTNSEVDATTFAKDYFTSSGIIAKKQNTVLTTRRIVSTTQALSETYTTSTSTTSNTFKDLVSCSAYSFLPKAPPGDEGLFLSSVDVYFQAKHPTLGIWFEVREMSPDGGITRNTVPFSVVWKKTGEVNVSSNGTVATNIKFSMPIFLYSDVQYAFVIHTEGINPGYNLWVARKGEYIFGSTTQQYTSRPLSGTFFTTNNNLNWIPVEGLDLKIKFNRASFATGTANIGTAVLGNKPYMRMDLKDVSSVVGGTTTTSITTIGESFVGNPAMTLVGNTGSIVVGDRLRGRTSGANSAVSRKDSNIFFVANNKFVNNETVDVYNSSNSPKGITSIISTIRRPQGKVNRFKTVNPIDINSGGFGDWKNRPFNNRGEFSIPNFVNSIIQANDTITGVVTGAVATVNAILDYRYSVVDFEPSYLDFNKTDITFRFRPYAYSGSLLDYISVKENVNYYYDSELKIMSRPNEIAALGSTERSSQIEVTMLTESEYMTPILDLERTHTLLIDNKINSNTVGETYTSAEITVTANGQYLNVGNFIEGSLSSANSTILSVDANTCRIEVQNAEFIDGETVTFGNGASTYTATIDNLFTTHNPYGGNLLNKYISKQAVLDDQQDAEDVQVILTAYRPPTSDVKVWMKIQHAEDSDTFPTVTWIELEKVGSDLYSSASNRNDFKEFTFKVPDSYLTGTIGDQDGVIQYTNSQGIQFSGFKYYQIKVGLLGQNSAIVPRVADLRVVALQK